LQLLTKIDSGGLETVLWSDETNLIIWSDGRDGSGRKPGENLNDWLVEGTLKFGGSSVMLWGCMMWEGIGYHARIDGRMDADLLQDSG